jgi:hypothetical protein
MKYLRVFFIFIITLCSYSQEVTCSSNLGCINDDINDLGTIVPTYWAQEEVLNFITDPIFENIDEFRFYSKELRSTSINMPSRNVDENASNIVFLTGLLDNISINLNGRSGERGIDSSEICASNIMNGDYGQSIKNQFLLDHNVDTSRCTPSDIQKIEQTFSCPAGYEDKSALQGIQNIVINKSKRVCNATFEQRYCVKRRKKIKCRMDIIGPYCNCAPSGSSVQDQLIRNANSMNTSDLKWVSSPIGWPCDPYSCTEKIKVNPQDPNEIAARNSGSYLEREFIVDESSILERGSQYACQLALSSGQTSFNVEWQLGEDSFTPLLHNGVEDSRNGLSFDIKLPQLIPNTDDGDVRVVSFNINNILGLTSGVTLRNCLGMDQSDVTDIRCELSAKTESFVMVMSLTDQFGAESSEFNLIVGGNDTKYSRTFLIQPENNSDIDLGANVIQGDAPSCISSTIPQIFKDELFGATILAGSDESLIYRNGEYFVDVTYKRDDGPTYRFYYKYNESSCLFNGFL